jgi:hypothetical protein
MVVALYVSWADHHTCILGLIRSYMWYTTFQMTGNWPGRITFLPGISLARPLEGPEFPW